MKNYDDLLDFVSKEIKSYYLDSFMNACFTKDGNILIKGTLKNTRRGMLFNESPRYYHLKNDCLINSSISINSLEYRIHKPARDNTSLLTLELI